jgi:hypothetical protein
MAMLWEPGWAGGSGLTLHRCPLRVTAFCLHSSLSLLQVLPEVTSVAPRTGSAGGGQLLTIRGRRFPPSTDAGSVEVAVGGHPCTVVSTSPSEITCLTASQEGAQQAPDAPWQPLYDQTGRVPGGRGIELAR